MSLHRAAAVTGIGETDYSRSVWTSDKGLQIEAIERAIEDAGLTPRDIDGFIPNAMGAGLSAETFASYFGPRDLQYTAMLHYGGATGIGGLQSAAMAVASGVARHVVVVSGRNGYSQHRMDNPKAAKGQETISPQMALSIEFEAPFGALVPGHFDALLARRHMHQYGTTTLQMGAVAVAMRRHAGLNAKAMMRAPITIEDHQASRLIIDPFRVLDCCVELNGAAAIVVSAADTVRDLRRKPVYVLGVAEGHPESPSSLATRKDFLAMGLRRAAPRAFGMAGVRPGDIRLAMIYDSYTFLVILQLEQLGICGPGEGGPFVEGGRLELDGELPTNTNGGLLSQGHSMSGMNNLVEGVKQVRGEAGEAQLARAEPCVVTGLGGHDDGTVVILGS